MSENIQEKATTPVDIYQAIPAARPLSDFAVEEVGDDLVILDGETLQYHALNLSAARIWIACDGSATAARIAEELDIPVDLVESTVAELGEVGLLQSPSAQWDSTLNRRRAAKLIAAGLVGAVGLPVIKSITAPDAAAAASIGQCAFGFSAGGWICVVCRFFGCACETVTVGGSGYCCVCGGSGLRAASGISESQFFAAVNKARNGEPLTWTDDEISSGLATGEEPISDDPYLATDEEGNVNLEAIDALEQEAAPETEAIEPIVEEVAPVEVVESQPAPVEVVESQPETTEIVDTSGEGEQETTEEQSS